MSLDKGNVSACIINNKFIYVVGGYNNNCTYLNEIERYTIADNEWECIHIEGDLQLPNRDSALTFKINSYEILIAGGEDDGEDLQDCFIFDTINNTLKQS